MVVTSKITRYIALLFPQPLHSLNLCPDTAVFILLFLLNIFNLPVNRLYSMRLQKFVRLTEMPASEKSPVR